mmetsp:Transcript_10036/g.16477  ORF Transcript_10036/g.16477 Transcript_10036/m.16477 type:complete len:108 (-) Transcript_10036:390-713(-)
MDVSQRRMEVSTKKTLTECRPHIELVHWFLPNEGRGGREGNSIPAVIYNYAPNLTLSINDLPQLCSLENSVSSHEYPAPLSIACFISSSLPLVAQLVSPASISSRMR